MDFDALVDADPSGMSEEELRQAVVALDRVRARLDGAASALVGAFDARGVWAFDGAKGASAWMTARTCASAGSCRAEVALARQVREMPVVAVAARDGRLSRDLVRALAWARQPDLVDAFEWCEADLVGEVAGLSVAGAWRYLRRWVLSMRELLERNEPDGPEPTDGHGPSKVTLSPGLDGRWFGSLDLTAEDGELVATAIDQQVQDMWDHNVFRTDDGLTTPERRAIAHVEVIRRGTRGGSHDGTARPLILGIIGLADLLGPQHRDDDLLLSSLPAGVGGGRMPLDPTAAGMVMALSELSRSGTVAPTILRRLACEGDIVPVIVGTDGTPLDMGDHIRLANRAQRRALRVRDGHCAFAGCDAPAHQCIAHHMTWWEHGGPTDLANLCLLCRYHHRRIHDDGFHITWHHGVLVTYRPDGSAITDTKPDIVSPVHRHQPPPGDPPRTRHRRRSRSPDDPDPETVALHRAARRRIDALLTEVRARHQQPFDVVDHSPPSARTS